MPDPAQHEHKATIDVPWYLLDLEHLRRSLTALIEAVEDDFSPHCSRGRRTVDAITEAKKVLDA